MLFISYRHMDVPDAAARVTELLVHRYGRRSIFIDVEGLQPGQVFPSELESTIRHCFAVLPVIGPNWEGKHANGSPRITDPHDWIARELLLAHSRNIPVLPVLVQRPALDSGSLPEMLRWLAPIQQTQATYDDLEHDLEKVFDVLDELILPRLKPRRRS